LRHLEEWGDKAGSEEVRVAVGWTEEGGTGCRRALEGHKRGKGTHRWTHSWQIELVWIDPQTRP
jgi:hypothetical protein